MGLGEADRLNAHQGHVFDERQVAEDEACDLLQAFERRPHQHHPNLDALSGCLKGVQPANGLRECALALDHVVVKRIVVTVERYAPGQMGVQGLELVCECRITEEPAIGQHMDVGIGQCFGASGNDRAESGTQEGGLTPADRQRWF